MRSTRFYISFLTSVTAFCDINTDGFPLLLDSFIVTGRVKRFNAPARTVSGNPEVIRIKILPQSLKEINASMQCISAKLTRSYIQGGPE